VQLARDAHVAGDPVMAESYLQHAEHYYRIIASAQALQTAQQQQQQGLPVTVEIDDADEDDFDNAVSDRYTFRTPQSFHAPEALPPGAPVAAPPNGQPRDGGEPRRYEPRDRPDYRPNENRRDDNRSNETRGDRNDRPPRNDRNDRQEFRRPERPAFSGDQPSYEPDQPQSAEPRDPAPREAVNGEGGDRNQRDRFNRRDQFRDRRDRPPREGEARPERPERVDARPERQDRPDRPERSERPERAVAEAVLPAAEPIGLPSFITQPTRLAPEPLAVAAEAIAEGNVPKKRGRKPKAQAEGDAVSDE
jgi:hypothetical protein